MQDSPIAGIRFIHTAIRRETADIERIAGTAVTPEVAASLSRKIDFLTLQIHLHTDGEATAIFPSIETKENNIAVHYLHDHAEEEKLLAAVKELSTVLEKESAGPRITEARTELLRNAIALRYHAWLHSIKEEQIIVPLVQKHFSPPEQGGIVQQVIGKYRPDQLSQTIPWTINWLDPDDREAYVRVMQKGMPPQAFNALKDWLRTGTPAEVWSDLQKRVPELAT